MLKKDFSCTTRLSLLGCGVTGEVAEWLKAMICKDHYTVKSRIGGSNPSPLRQFLEAAVQSLPTFQNFLMENPAEEELCPE
jgi:hypothetical protein